MRDAVLAAVAGFALLATGLAAVAQPVTEPPSWVIRSYLVSDLPANARSGVIVQVRDSATTGDCSTGGGDGSIRTLCIWNGSGWVTVGDGGAGTGAGIVGGVAGESALAALYDLEGLQEPAIMAETGYQFFYFDADNGSDSNTGSSADPFQTLSQANDVCVGARVICTFDGADTWDRTGTNEYGQALVSLESRCESEDDLCIWLRSRTRIGTTSLWVNDGQKATIDCDGDPSAKDGIIEVGDANPDTGWVVVEGFNVICNDGTDGTDAFDVSNDASMIVINSACQLTTTGVNDQCYTAHNSANLVIINSGCEINPNGTASDGNNQCIASAGGNITFVGNNTLSLDKQSGANIAGVITYGFSDPPTGEAEEALVIGPFITATSNVANSTIACQRSANENDNGITVTSIRTVCSQLDNTGALRESYSHYILSDDSPNTTLFWTSYQEVAIDIERGVRFAVDSTDGSISTSNTIEFNGFLMDLVERSQWWADSEWWENIAGLSVTLNTWSYDEAEGAGQPFLTGDGSGSGTAHATFAAFESALQGNSAPWTFNDGNDWDDILCSQCLAGDVPVCDSATPATCAGGYETTYTVDVPGRGIPSFVLGEEITSFELNGAGGNIGR